MRVISSITSRIENPDSEDGIDNIDSKETGDLLSEIIKRRRKDLRAISPDPEPIESRLSNHGGFPCTGP